MLYALRSAFGPYEWAANPCWAIGLEGTDHLIDKYRDTFHYVRRVGQHVAILGELKYLPRQDSRRERIGYTGHDSSGWQEFRSGCAASSNGACMKRVVHKQPVIGKRGLEIPEPPRYREAARVPAPVVVWPVL